MKQSIYLQYIRVKPPAAASVATNNQFSQEIRAKVKYQLSTIDWNLQ